MQPTVNQMCPDELLAGVATRAESDTAAGLSAVENLLRSYPEDSRLHFLKGSLLAALNRFSEALRPFGEALRIDPQFVIARFQLGLLQLTSGDVTAANATWAPLRDLGTEEPLRLFAEGLQRLTCDDFAGAEMLLKEGIRRNSQVPALNRDMQLILDEMAARAASDGAEMSSSAQLLLQLSSRGTRH